MVPLQRRPSILLLQCEHWLMVTCTGSASPLSQEVGFQDPAEEVQPHLEPGPGPKPTLQVCGPRLEDLCFVQT